MQEERRRNIETYTDSLRLHNRELNRKLRTLITSLDEQALLALQNKEIRLKDSYEHSTLVITGLIIFSIILLIVSYLIIQRDIREKARNKERLEETIGQNTALLEMRKNIILTISHDIRAPLNIISGSAELAMDTREKKRRNSHLNNIRIVCKHVVHLLNNLLDVYRLNEAKETRNDVPFSLNDLLERVASGFSHVVTNKGILFRQDFKDTYVNLYGDVDRIEQIMDNLLTNAVKFTESGAIELNARYHDGVLLLEVKDSGIGMSPETLSRIFRPFERLTSATNVDGVGLGLPITKGIVKLLGGEINVTSDIGQGTTFRVTLPLNITDEPVENENRILPHPEHLPLNVLVIDDDTMFLDVIKEMLERNGITCTLCRTAKEVVKAIRSKDYDLLLSDILMPGTSGFDLLDLLRNSNVGNSREIPVIAMTARGDREKEAFLNAGFIECIYKPFSSTELLSLLSTINTDRTEEKQKADFSMILAEVSDKPKTLRSFIGQLKNDRKELEAAMRYGARQSLSELAHRMQPMWELLQTEDVLIGLRSLLKKDDYNDSELNSHIQKVIDTVSVLITEAEDEIKNWRMKRKILIVEDNIGLSQMQKDWFGQAGYDAITAMNEPIARSLIRKNNFDLIVSDVRLPEGDGISLLKWLKKEKMDIPFIITTEYVSVPDVVRTIKLGARDYLPKPVHREHLLELAEDIFRPIATKREQKKELFKRTCPKMLEVDRCAKLVAPSDMSVLILGSNGTGKESVAQSIHEASERVEMPFVAVNCGVLPRELAASMLFGHAKGAFTGADTAKEGFFDMAKGGTLFLDEIGTMPFEIQSMLLRVLQENTYIPIGGNKERVADVRIVAATNENIEKAILEGRFREDLYHRLNEFEIRQPSLAECPEDILPLAEFFRKRFSKELKRDTAGFSDAGMCRLRSYSWPGNVRELQNRIKRAVLLAEGPLLDFADLEMSKQPDKVALVPAPVISPLKDKENEKETIINALKACNGHREQAARLLKINPSTLYRKMNKYRLK